MPNIIHFHCLLRPRRGSAHIAEFGVGLFILLFFFVFPVINLMAIAVGAATVWFTTFQCAQAASTSANYVEAMNKMQSVAILVSQSGIGQMAKIKAKGGAAGCGADLYIDVTEIATGPGA